MTTALAPLTALTADEAARLECLENAIKRGIETFYGVGAALIAIRDEKLYKAQFGTFEQYLSERWAIKRTHGYQLMNAASVVTNLSAIANTLPANEHQARQLAGLTTDEQRAVWTVIEQTAPDRSNVTTAHIKSVVSVFREIVQTGALDNGNGESVAVHDLVRAAVTEETYERLARQTLHIMERAAPRKLIARGKATVSEVVVRGEQAAVTLVMDASELGALGAGSIVNVVIREDASA